MLFCKSWTTPKGYRKESCWESHIWPNICLQVPGMPTPSRAGSREEAHWPSSISPFNWALPVTVIPAPFFSLEWQWSWVAWNNSLCEAAPLEAVRLNPCGILLQGSAHRGLWMCKWHPLSGESRKTSVNICSQASKSPVWASPQTVLWQDGYQEESVLTKRCAESRKSVSSHCSLLLSKRAEPRGLLLAFLFSCFCCDFQRRIFLVLL